MCSRVKSHRLAAGARNRGDPRIDAALRECADVISRCLPRQIGRNHRSADLYAGPRLRDIPRGPAALLDTDHSGASRAARAVTKAAVAISMANAKRSAVAASRKSIG